MPSPRGERSGKRPTQADVAERAGVSHKSVSLALSGLGSDKMVGNVRAAARELGYEKGPRSRKSGVVGIVVPDFDDPIWPEVQGLVGRLPSFLRTSEIHFTNAKTDQEVAAKERESIAKLSGTDAVIAINPRSPLSEWRQYLEPSTQVVVLTAGSVDERAPGEFSYISVDNKGGVKKAIDHLVKLGHERIAFVAGPELRPDEKIRSEAYEAEMRRLSLWDDRNFQHGDSRELDMTAGEKAAELFIQRYGPQPTAILVPSGEAAVGAMDAIRRYGLRVPKDISVVVFGDDSVARAVRPELTRVELVAGLKNDLIRELFMIDGEGPTRNIIGGGLILGRSTASVLK